MTQPIGQVVLDTNIVLQLARGNEYGRRIDATYQLSTLPYRPIISIVTVGELFAFARHRGWGQDRIEILNKLVGQLVVVDINRTIVERYAEIHAFLIGSGRPAGDNDVWIAATAAATSALLITTDKDFDPLAEVHLRLSRFELSTKKN